MKSFFQFLVFISGQILTQRQTLRKKRFANSSNAVISKSKSFQLKASWIKWLLIYRYHGQIRQIEHSISQKHRQKLVAIALKKWLCAFRKNQKLKALKFRLLCKRFYVWWRLQTSLSRHFANIHCVQILGGSDEESYHSLDQKSRNVFAYWYTKKLQKVFKEWRRKQLYRGSMRLKSSKCSKMHEINQQKYHYQQWKFLFLAILQYRQIIEDTSKIIKCVAVKHYILHWREYKDKQNLKRQNSLQSHLFYSRNRLVKVFNFWKISSFSLHLCFSLICVVFTQNPSNVLPRD